MDEFDDNEIARLLRLKRYELPPSGYFENFLHEFHRRQRDELLKQPLWRIAMERVHDFMFRLNVPSLTSYPAAATATLLIAALLSLRMYQSSPNDQRISEHGPSVTPVSAEEWTLDSVPSRPLSTKPLRNYEPGAHTQRA